MDNPTQISSTEVRATLRRLSDEMRLVRQARANLAGRRDPITSRNIAQLSVKLRDLTAQHEEMRQVLITRGEISG